MGLGSIGPATLILIVIVALLLFGPNKLPELGRAFGRTLKEFKKGTKEAMSNEDDEQEDRKEIQRSEDDDKNNKNNDNRRLPD